MADDATRNVSGIPPKPGAPLPIRDDAQLPSLPSGPSFGTLQGNTATPMSGKGGRLLGGKFRVLKELGAGGAGAVYEVMHEVTHHRRALKLMKLKDSDENVERLFREASAAGRIGNEHIIETLDAGRFETGEIFILMELCEGETLFKYIEKHRSVTMRTMIELVCQAADGLHAAHEAGIVHRDVKPANMIVTKRDGKPFLKILDFGISKFDTKITEVTELTTDGALLGTPSYMAPEQLKGDVIDRRVDIYALGVTLYSTCSGKRPFNGRTFPEIAMAICSGDHIPLWQACPHLSPSLTQIVEKAMSPKAEDRFATAAEFADALRSELIAAAEHEARAVPPEGQTADSSEGASAKPQILTVDGPSRARSRMGPVAAGIGAVCACLVGIFAAGVGRHPEAPKSGTQPPPTEVEVTPQVPRKAPPIPAVAPPAPTDDGLTPKMAPTAKPSAAPVQTGPGPAGPAATHAKPTGTGRTPLVNHKNPYD